MQRNLVEIIVLDAALLLVPAAAGTSPPFPMINVTTAPYNAVGDAVMGLTDCSLTTTTQLQCTNETFSSADQNKVVVIDDAGVGGGPLITHLPNTISGTSNTFSLVQSATSSISLAHVSSLSVVLGGSGTAPSGTGYGFSTSQTLSCGSCTPNVAATGMPVLLGAVSATIGNPGTGGTTSSLGTTGNCTVTDMNTSPLGGVPSTFQVHIIHGTLTAVNSIAVVPVTANSNVYSSSTGSYTEPVSGCGSLTGASLNVSYGVLVERLTAGTGSYLASSPPACSNTSTLSMNGTITAATGLTVTCNAYKGTVSYGTDNTGGLQRALGRIGTAGTNTMNYASAHAFPTCIYIPAGNYLTDVLYQPGTNTFLEQGYGCWLGDEHLHTNIFVKPNVAGDVFAWIDSNKNGAQVPQGNTQTFSDISSGHFNQAGSSFRNISVFGNRASTTVQNAIMFYGPTEFAFIDNCSVSYIRGRAFGAGYQDTASQGGDFNESRVENCHFDNSGDTGTAPVPGSTSITAPVPAFEITATGATMGTNSVDGSNNLDIANVRLFDAWGPAMWLHPTSDPHSSMRSIRMSDVKIEGSGMSQVSAGGDLLKIGNGGSDAATNTNVSDVLGRNIELVNPPIGNAALHVAATSANIGKTGSIDIEGDIVGSGGDVGRGVQIDGCPGCSFKQAQNTSGDYNLMVGSNTGGVCGGALLNGMPLIYDGIGAEKGLSTCIDPAVLGLVQFPSRQVLATGAASGLPAVPLPDQVSSITATGGTTYTVFGTIVFGISLQAPQWSIFRTGPTATFTDKWDTAADFVSQLGSAAQAGQLYHARVCNLSGGRGNTDGQHRRDLRERVYLAERLRDIHRSPYKHDNARDYDRQQLGLASATRNELTKIQPRLRQRA